MSDQPGSPPPAEGSSLPWDSQAAVFAVRSRVQTFLLRETEIGMDQRERLFVTRGSTRATLEFTPREDTQRVYIVITCPIAFYVPESPALFERIARDADKWYFGHLGISPYAPDSEHAGQVLVYLSHTLIGDFLDPPELLTPLFNMLNTADEIDNSFVTEFGGEVYDSSR